MGITRKIPVQGLQNTVADIRQPLEFDHIIYTFPESGTLVGGNIEVCLYDLTHNSWTGPIHTYLMVLPPGWVGPVAASQAQVQLNAKYIIGGELHNVSISDQHDVTFPINTMRKVFPNFQLVVVHVATQLGTYVVGDTVSSVVHGNLMFNG